MDEFVVTNGPPLQMLYVAMALRKADVLPVVLERLSSGTFGEKRRLCKLIRYTQWTEAVPVLIALATSDAEGMPVRVRALSALAWAAPAEAAEPILGMLRAGPENEGVVRAAMTLLARSGTPAASSAIEAYLQDDDVFVRLAAAYALGAIGRNVDLSIALAAVEEDDYVVREEACTALGEVGGEQAEAVLGRIAERDPNESVRRAARLAGVRATTKDLEQRAKVEILSELVRDRDQWVRKWAIEVLLSECGRGGIDAVAAVADERSKAGRVCALYLTMLGVAEAKEKER